MCSFRVLYGSDKVFCRALGVGKRPPTHARKRPCPALKANPQKMTTHGGSHPDTSCCKLTLDKKLKLDPEATFRDSTNNRRSEAKTYWCNNRASSSPCSLATPRSLNHHQSSQIPWHHPKQGTCKCSPAMNKKKRRNHHSSR